jgi:hypothetical protein
MVTKNVDLKDCLRSQQDNLTRIKSPYVFKEVVLLYVCLKDVVDVLGLDCQMGEC